MISFNARKKTPLDGTVWQLAGWQQVAETTGTTGAVPRSERRPSRGHALRLGSFLSLVGRRPTAQNATPPAATATVMASVATARRSRPAQQAAHGPAAEARNRHAGHGAEHGRRKQKGRI
jgi:hypothetical protein